MKFFYRIALQIYKWACILKIPFPSSEQVEMDLVKLHPSENRRQLCTEYYVNKLAKSLMICCVGVFLGVIVGVQAKQNGVIDESGMVVRGEYEEGAQQVEVECILPDGVQEFELEVAARVYTDAEVELLYDSFYTELPELILGRNASLQEVVENLSLKDSYEGYPFLVEWRSENPDIVRSDGTVSEVEEGVVEVELVATISYEDWGWERSLNVQVIALPLTQEQRMSRDIKKLLDSSEENSRTEGRWKLPESWQGQELKWKEKTDNTGLIIGIGTCIVSILIYLLADKDLHDNVEKRKQQMKKQYPDVTHKLVLYLGAGTTIRWAFQRMAAEYEQERKKGGKECPIYEEVVHTCRELKAGVSEGAAYEHFGKRTGLQEYIRLSTLLTQNLKKGNGTLLQRLREEADRASMERIQYSKRLGEEAVTKLLLPMVMMLLVVMLIIMIPAFSSVGV